MRKGIALLITLILLCTPLIIQRQVVITQDCFVQIQSVNLNKSTLSIGEKLQINITYDLFYDTQDPLGMGVIAVSIYAERGEPPIFEREFTEMGISIRKSLQLDILPQDWSPNETGQVGEIKVDGWVQDSHGSMTDSIIQEIWTIRSEVQIIIDEIPANLVYHDEFNLTAHFLNYYNDSIVLSNHPISIIISEIEQPIQVWEQNTSFYGNVCKLTETVSLGTGNFICNITSEPDDDYIMGSTHTTFKVGNADLNLEVQLNATTFQAYYPTMNNCTALVKANITCLSTFQNIPEANVTWNLGNNNGTLSYLSEKQFWGEVPMPIVPGDYNFSIVASVQNHNLTDTWLPLEVKLRRLVIFFSTNRTHAANGDIIELSVIVFDEGCFKPISGKEISLYVLNFTDWILLDDIMLNNSGFASCVWQAQELDGEDSFIFKIVFHGGPEYDNQEELLVVDNTHNIRFLTNSIINAIRGNSVYLPIQITTLDYIPLSEIKLQLDEVETNETLCIDFTNASGYANLTWGIFSQYELGKHKFRLIAEDVSSVIGTITITLIVYDSTVMIVL